MNFWQKLPRPFTVLAPMEDVTDVVYRQLIAEIAKPDVMFTEFTSAEGLLSPGSEAVAVSLRYKDEHRPIVAQIWGTTPEAYEKSARMIVDMGFDGIDINMGCPVKKIIKKGACSMLIKNHSLAQEIIDATKQGAGNIPVSVKTRIGFDKVETETWGNFLLEQNIAALTIHGRTAKNMSRVPADWDEIKKIVTLRNHIAPDTIIIGNGDVKDYETVLKRNNETGVDGVMIGRGIFENPWVFEKHIPAIDHTNDELLDLLLRHVELHHEEYGDSKRFLSLRKFFRTYTRNLPDARVLRVKLMECENVEEIRNLVEDFRETNPLS